MFPAEDQAFADQHFGHERPKDGGQYELEVMRGIDDFAELKKWKEFRRDLAGGQRRPRR